MVKKQDALTEGTLFRRHQVLPVPTASPCNVPTSRLDVAHVVGRLKFVGVSKIAGEKVDFVAGMQSRAEVMAFPSGWTTSMDPQQHKGKLCRTCSVSSSSDHQKRPSNHQSNLCYWP